MENPKKRNWKVLTSEYLARKPWFTVRHESIERPDGRRIPDYYVFEYPDWVNVIAITKEGKFVFIDQYRHGLGETDYEIPAGVAEPDDASMLAAAQRELAEETGYGGGQWRELMVVAQPLDAEQPDVLLPGDGRGTPGRTAPRCYGGHPRAPVLGRRGSRPARKRPHPAGTDGRTPVALRRGVRPLAPRKTAGDTAVPRYSQDGAPRRVGFSGFARNLQGEGKRKTKPCTPCIYPSPSNCWSECWA